MAKESGGKADAGPWEELAGVYAASRQVSADRLVEWPAQLRLCGDFRGLRVLDVGCGTGEKARYFAERGAAAVAGVDPSSGFEEVWAAHAECANLTLLHGSFEDLSILPELQGQTFDLIVCFQALMYARDLARTVREMAALLVPGGALTISVPHPFRFAVMKSEIEGWGLGFAYQQTEAYRYPSPWKPEILLEHAMPRVADYVNAIASAGLRIVACEEPPVTEELRTAAPEKAEWMDRYVGILVLRAQLESSGFTTGEAQR